MFLGGLKAPCLVNSGPLHANWEARPPLLGRAPVFAQHTYPHLIPPSTSTRLPASSRCYTYLRIDENYHFCGTSIFDKSLIKTNPPPISPILIVSHGPGNLSVPLYCSATLKLLRFPSVHEFGALMISEAYHVSRPIQRFVPHRSCTSRSPLRL